MAKANTGKATRTPATIDVKEAGQRLADTIARALKGYERGREGIQKAAIACLVHAFNHADYSHSLLLIEGLGDSNGKAMRLWFEKFGGFSYDLENRKVAGWKGKKHIEEHMDAARGKPWYTMTPPNAFTGASFEDDLRKVLKRYSDFRAKIANGKLSEADRQKINFEVSQGAIDTLLSMCNFEVIDGTLRHNPPITAEVTPAEKVEQPQVKAA